MSAPKPDAMLEMLDPLAKGGNEFAAVAQLRILSAEDPEAEAQKVMDEAAETARKVAEVLGPFIAHLERLGVRS